MSISPIIDAQYRLQPRDLGHQDHVVTIQNVSWQGLEILTPLLHLHEFPEKRLVLESVQYQELLSILGTPQEADWIGERLILATQSDPDQLRIHLFPLDQLSNHSSKILLVRIPDGMGMTLLLLLIFALLLMLVALLDPV